jgi:hypothetical protein
MAINGCQHRLIEGTALVIWKHPESRWSQQLEKKMVLRKILAGLRRLQEYHLSDLLLVIGRDRTA